MLSHRRTRQSASPLQPTIFSRVPVGFPTAVMFENDRYSTPPPSSRRDFVGGLLNTPQPSLSCAIAGEQKIAINNKIPATFFIDNVLPRGSRFIGNCFRAVSDADDL